MIYQVKAELYFKDRDQAVDFARTCQVTLDKTIVVNPGDINEQRSTVVLIECHHDESPLSPCQVAKEYPIPTPE